MKPVFVSPRAYADIRYLEAWLAERNTTAALKVGPLLFEAMMSLREFPERGRQAVNYRGRELNVLSARTPTSFAIASNRTA